MGGRPGGKLVKAIRRGVFYPGQENKPMDDLDPEVQQLMNISALCIATNSLPRGGGLLDQGRLEVEAITALLNAQQEKANQDAKKKGGSGAPRHS
jgi:hypothetical protein